MSLWSIGSQTNALRKIILDVIVIIVLAYAIIAYIIQSIPPLYSYTLASMGIAAYLIHWLFEKRRKDRVREDAAYVNEMWRPKSLFEMFHEQTEKKEIGDSLLKLKKKFGEGFLPIDVRIIEALQRGYLDSKRIAIFLHEDEKNIKARLKFLKVKAKLISSG